MFRQITLFIILMTCYASANAQLQKGNKFIGGGLSFFHNSFEQKDAGNVNTIQPNSATTFNFLPQIGFLVSDHIAIGGELNYTRTKRKQQFFTGSGFSDFSTTQNIYGVAPFLKVYWKLAKKAGFTLDAKTGVGFGKEKNEFDSNISSADSDIFALDIDVKPSFYYFITPRLGVEASFGGIFYQYQNLKTENQGSGEVETNQTNFSSNFGSSLFFSFKYYFGKGFDKAN
jgi:hypothetical protein